MERENQLILKRLQENTRQFEENWPDEIGMRFSRWLDGSSIKVREICTKKEELLEKADKIRKTCQKVLGEEESDTSRKLTKHL